VPCQHSRDPYALVEQVRDGKLPRRSFIQQMVSVGLSAPAASMMLIASGIAQPLPTFVYKGLKRGGGGLLKLLLWQAPTLLNPHFASGLKDSEGSRLFCEPLAYYDADGNLVPALAAEIPSRANGGISADGRSTTWKLKPSVAWHDGAPFGADDVIFNWQFAIDPATAAVTLGGYAGIGSVRAPRSPFWRHVVRTLVDMDAKPERYAQARPAAPCTATCSTR
jgi:peptide/nickel transport system substrate-binding protein